MADVAPNSPGCGEKRARLPRVPRGRDGLGDRQGSDHRAARRTLHAVAWAEGGRQPHRSPAPPAAGNAEGAQQG
eukprot:13388197-Alexandrium_andersonii.AAC.1